MAEQALDEVVAQRDRLLKAQRVLVDVAARLGPALELQPVLDIALAAMQDVVDDVWCTSTRSWPRRPGQWVPRRRSACRRTPV